MAVQGATGAPGEAGISWQGIWNATTAYQTNNAVAYNGSIYFSTQGGINQEPISVPCTGLFWPAWEPQALLDQRAPVVHRGPWDPTGATGATGPAGPQGATGAAGQAGISWEGIWNATTTYQVTTPSPTTAPFTLAFRGALTRSLTSALPIGHCWRESDPLAQRAPKDLRGQWVPGTARSYGANGSDWTTGAIRGNWTRRAELAEHLELLEFLRSE